MKRWPIGTLFVCLPISMFAYLYVCMYVCMYVCIWISVWMQASLVPEELD
jgi:hypothetical protein